MLKRIYQCAGSNDRKEQKGPPVYKEHSKGTKTAFSLKGSKTQRKNHPEMLVEGKGYIIIKTSPLSPKESKVCETLKPFLACLAQFDLPNPLGLENLRGIDTARRIRVQNGIDHVAATGLRRAC